MIRPDFREIYHYGMPRRSGRYPYGSGERPYQDRSKVSISRKKLLECNSHKLTKERRISK